MKLRLGKTDFFLGYGTVAAVTAVLLTDRENRVICCILAAFLHECGHLLMMRLTHTEVRAVKLRLFDVLIESGDSRSVSADVLITLAGPAMNLLCFALFIPWSEKLALPHLALGVFNLLPVISLDGGHLLEIFLQKKYNSVICARILRVITFITILPLMTAGILLLLNSGYNYSLLAISLYLTAVLFIKK